MRLDVISVILVKGDALVMHLAGGNFAHIAQVPRLVVVVHDVAPVFGVSQDEAVFMAMLTHPDALLGRVERPSHGMLQRCDIDGKSRLVLTETSSGGISFWIALVGSLVGSNPRLLRS